MCGRYTLAYEDFDFMLEYYGIHHADFSYPPRYNVAPGQHVPAVIHDGKERRIGLLKWGLVPSWAEDAKSGFKMINARAETITTRKTFHKLIQRKRCLIPADGFYEWKKSDDGTQPMRIVLNSRKFFSFAGLYDTWVSSTGEKLSTCTIITTRPNELMQQIHTRMPVILDKSKEEEWVDRNFTDANHMASLLTSYPSEDMRAYPVSKIVGNVNNDVPACVEMIS
ncbi:SOS response-associated peptidase [Alicyclobacillus sp. SO9]|uniref:SOS response-associated peptidase n=1 Tax=Alicyclobacillus sp. SO9 TaxID=2665646 RepID=UPI0018E795B7|nr:SOS response-associated peptidase [Alicyclobacillus sp. SO9]QQE79958.1 SOS response-associated peptidase [Alicyclobacillus sp. SO9]